MQDRFTKALRVAGIRDIDAANALLQTHLAAHPQRFAKPPLDPEDAHRPLACSAAELQRTLSHHHLRTVDKHGAIRFERLALHIDPHHRQRTRGKRLTVIRSGDKLELWHGHKPIPFAAFDIQTWRAKVHDRKTLDAMPDQRPAAPRNDLRKPAANHPWRHTPL